MNPKAVFMGTKEAVANTESGEIGASLAVEFLFFPHITQWICCATASPR